MKDPMSSAGKSGRANLAAGREAELEVALESFIDKNGVFRPRYRLADEKTPRERNKYIYITLGIENTVLLK